MTTFEQLSRYDPGAELRSFLDHCDSIVDRHIQQAERPITEMDEDEQQTLVDKINAYLEFELNLSETLRGIPVIAEGMGLLLVCDEAGNVIGAETIADGDVISGVMVDTVVLPVPTIECVLDAGDEGVPSYDQVLSPIALLGSTVFKTGVRPDGLFELEHDLSQYRVGIVLAHPLDLRIDET